MIKRPFIGVYGLDFISDSAYKSKMVPSYEIETDIPLHSDAIGCWDAYNDESSFRQMLEEMLSLITIYGEGIFQDLYIKVTDIPPSKKIKFEKEDELFWYEHHDEMAQRGREKLNLNIDSSIEDVMRAIERRAREIGADNYHSYKHEIWDMAAVWGDEFIKYAPSKYEWCWDDKLSQCRIEKTNKILGLIRPMPEISILWRDGNIDLLYEKLKRQLSYSYYIEEIKG